MSGEAKIRLEAGCLRLDVGDLCDALDDESKLIVAQQLGANEHLWKQVLAALVDPSNGFEVVNDWWSFDRRTMLEIREKLIPLMPEVARLAVQEALRQRDDEKANGERHQRWAWAMWHAHRDAECRFGNPSPWPELPEWAPAERAAMAVRDAAPDLLEALDHPCLRELFGAIEDSGTKEADALWSRAVAWFEVRDAALKKARGE